MGRLRVGSFDFGPTNRITDCVDIQAVEFGTQLIKGHEAIGISPGLGLCPIFWRFSEVSQA